MDQQEVTFEIGKLTLNKSWFSYLTDQEKSEIKNDIKSGLSHTVKVTINGTEKFGAIVDVFPDQIHVREVGGNFTKDIRWLEVYCLALGKFSNAKLLTVCARRDGVGFIAKRLGFKLNDQYNEFEKVINHGR